MTVVIYSHGIFRKGAFTIHRCKDPRASATSYDLYINSRERFNIIILIVAYVLFTRDDES